MAANNLSGPTTLSLPTAPDSGADDPHIPAPIFASENPDQDDPDPTRDPKRRRYFPKALEKVEDLLIAPQSSNPCFSFTFDTKSAASSPEITPKFGSFNFVASNSDENSKEELEKAEEEEEEGEEEREQSEINGIETETDLLIETVEDTKEDPKNDGS